MFLGTTPPQILDYFAGELRRIKPRRVFEPFAGNFSISQVCGEVDKSIEVRSGDVSLYSSAIGFGLMKDAETEVGLSEECIRRFPAWASLSSPEDIAAAAILICEYVAADVHRKNVKYYENYARDIERRYETYHKEILEKVRKAKAKLPTNFAFRRIDAMRVLKHEPDAGDVVFFDPPYYSGDYEKMFKGIDELMTGVETPYTDFTMPVKLATIRELHERGVLVYYRHEEPIEAPGFQQRFRYAYKPDKSYNISTNVTDSATAQGAREMINEKAPNLDVIYHGDRLTADMQCWVFKLEGAEANHYRLLWTRKSNLSSLGDYFGVAVGHPGAYKIVGIFGVAGVGTKMQTGGEHTYIVSDSVPPHNDYRRLSKLILYVLLTQETLKMLTHRYHWPQVGYSTTVFSNNPSSMKYRGLFDLEEKEEGDKHGTGYKYRLIYRTKRIPWETVTGAYRAWFKEHGHLLTTEPKPTP